MRTDGFLFFSLQWVALLPLLRTKTFSLQPVERSTEVVESRYQTSFQALDENILELAPAEQETVSVRHAPLADEQLLHRSIEVIAYSIIFLVTMFEHSLGNRNAVCYKDVC